MSGWRVVGSGWRVVGSGWRVVGEWLGVVGEWLGVVRSGWIVYSRLSSYVLLSCLLRLVITTKE
jgi:hypothetical protein